MKRTTIAFTLFSTILPCYGARQYLNPKKTKNYSKQHIKENLNNPPGNNSFVGLFKQLITLQQSAVYPNKSTLHKLQTTQQQMQTKLHRMQATLRDIAPNKSTEICAQLKDQLSSSNAEFFDHLFKLTSFIQSSTPDHTQALECLTLIKTMYDQGNTQCKEAQYLLCSAAFERSIVALQVSITYAEQRAETLQERVTRLERELAARKEDAEMVKRSTAALFELAPALFRKYNELARQVAHNDQRLTTVEAKQSLINKDSALISPALSPTTSSEMTEASLLSDNDEFEVIEPELTLP